MIPYENADSCSPFGLAEIGVDLQPPRRSRGAKKPAGASLARLARENEACRAAAAAHAAAADLAALCRRAPGPMGGCYTEKPLLIR